jgi:hypothetical protein
VESGERIDGEMDRNSRIAGMRASATSFPVV